MTRTLAILLSLFAIAASAQTYRARVVLGGDSTMEGYDQWASPLDGGPSGNNAWDNAWLMWSNSTQTIWATNYARQGWDWSQVWLQQTPYFTNTVNNASDVVIRCGVNDIVNNGVGTFFSTSRPNMDLIAKVVCPLGIRLWICEITPFNSDVKTWNGYYATWCATNSYSSNTLLLVDHDLFGLAGDNYTAINPALAIDSVHPNQAGNNLSSAIIMTNIFNITPILPTNRATVWAGNVGVKGGIPDSYAMTVYTNLPPAGSIPNAMSACPSNQVVQLYTNATYDITGADGQSFGSGKVLRGDPGGTTKVRTSGTINIRAQTSGYLNTHALLTVNALQGATNVTVGSTPTWARPGMTILISSKEEDTNFISHVSVESGDEHDAMWYATGEERAMCQLNRVISTNSTTINLETPLLWTYKTQFVAQVDEPPITVGSMPISKVGFENLVIEGNADDGDTQTFNLENAVDSWIYNCTITNQIGRNAVHFDWSYRNTIKKTTICYSHRSAAGQGYGVGIYNGSCNNLVEDCILFHLHAGVDISYGSSANVISYSCFLTNYIDPAQNMSTTAPAIASHAVHNCFNLFEGNYAVEPVTGDITHGSSSHHTVFRNRLTGNGFTSQAVPLIIQQYSRYYNVIGNVLGDSLIASKYDGATSGAQNACGTAGIIYEIGCGLSPNDSVSRNAILRNCNAVFTNSTASIKNGGYLTNEVLHSYYIPDASWPPSWMGSCTNGFAPWRTTAAQIDKTNVASGLRFVTGSSGGGGGGGPVTPANAVAQNVRVQTLILR